MSLVVMNCGFAVYYNDQNLHNWIVALGIIFMVVPIILQALIFIATYKGRNSLEQEITDNGFCMFWWWVGFMVVWFIVGMVLFFVYLPYNGWSIDSAFPTTSQMRNVFFIIQGVPGLFCVAAGLAIGIYFLGLCMCQYSCLQWFKDEVTDAKNQVNGFTNLDETKPDEEAVTETTAL